jgi:AP endonuclease-1
VFVTKTRCDECHMLFLTRPQSFRSALITRRVPLPATPLRFVTAMPPKSKRKVSDGSLPPTKRVKKTDTMDSKVSVASTSVSQIDAPGQPTNTQLPDEISFPGSIAGRRRIAAWNICGWAAANKKVRSSTKLDVY